MSMFVRIQLDAASFVSCYGYHAVALKRKETKTYTGKKESMILSKKIFFFRNFL